MERRDARRVGRRGLCGLVLAVLAGCSTTPPRDGAPSNPPDLSSVSEPTPRHEPPSRYGNPHSYTVFGKTYKVLSTSRGYVERGHASWYGTKFHGKLTSNREVYDMYGMTAAHKSLPLPTYARVTNLNNGRSVVVRINDRGPFHADRIIDLSYAAAEKLGILQKGTGYVEVKALDPGEPALQTASTTPASVGTAPGTEAQWGSEFNSGKHKQGVYLQVGAFVSRANAERLRVRLASEIALPISVHEAPTPEHGRIYRVRIGPFADPADADRHLPKVNAMRAGLAELVTEPPIAVTAQ